MTFLSIRTRLVLSTAVVFALVSALGCGSDSNENGNQPDRDSSTNTAGDDARIDFGPAPESEWRQVEKQYSILSTVAGKGETDNGAEWLSSYENGPATEAELSRPHFAMADAEGNIYIADKEAHAVRRVDAITGLIATVAGTNEPADMSDVDDSEGPAIERKLLNPNGLFVLPDGTFYILDLGTARVRRVKNGDMSTLFIDPNGFGLGRGLWVETDTEGRETAVYYCASSVIRRWTPKAGIVDWVDGFAGLSNLAMDERGSLLASDRNNGAVYLITEEPGGETVSTQIAGSGEAKPLADSTTARAGVSALKTPLPGARAVWFHESGGFFVGLHEGCQLWYVDTKGYAHLFLEGARNAHAGDGDRYDTPGAKVSELRSVSLDHSGNLLIVETDEGYVRKVDRTDDVQAR
ncbi:MAG: hypothetical protein JXA30_12090 [Deltaproteobacteria bacterium]|nr:hypothetical protein [Deltaproteobacteria bacterium]